LNAVLKHVAGPVAYIVTTTAFSHSSIGPAALSVMLNRPAPARMGDDHGRPNHGANTSSVVGRKGHFFFFSEFLKSN